MKVTGRSRIRLIHWNAAEAKQCAALLRALVYDVRCGPIENPFMRDLGQAEVRAAGLANGIGDYKVCAIDSTWSGLKFARRDLKKRPR